MSYYEDNFVEQNMENYNNLEEGYNNGDNFYYLTENEQAVGGLDDNIYQEEDNYVEHMSEQRQAQTQQAVVPLPVPMVAAKTQVKVKKVKKDKAQAGLNWLYILLVIVVISLIAYYLIDKKIIKMPSFGSSGSTASPSSSSFGTTLGSTFMSLH